MSKNPLHHGQNRKASSAIPQIAVPVANTKNSKVQAFDPKTYLPLPTHKPNPLRYQAGKTANQVVDEGVQEIMDRMGLAPRALNLARHAIIALVEFNYLQQTQQMLGWKPGMNYGLEAISDFFLNEDFCEFVLKDCPVDAVKEQFSPNGNFRQMTDRAQLEYIQPILRVI